MFDFYAIFNRSQESLKTIITKNFEINKAQPMEV